MAGLRDNATWVRSARWPFMPEHPFISRVNHSISLSGKIALAFAVALFVLLFGAMFMVGGDGTAPAVTHVSMGVMDFTAELVGVPLEQAMIATVAFWSLVVFVAGFVLALMFSGGRSISTDQSAWLWSLGIVAVALGAASFLIRNHQAKETVVDERALVLEFVGHNAEVMQAASGKAEVDLLGYSQSKNEPAIYEVAVYGPKTLYAFVKALPGSPAPTFTLLCTTPLGYSERDPAKDPCEQK